MIYTFLLFKSPLNGILLWQPEQTNRDDLKNKRRISSIFFLCTLMELEWGWGEEIVIVQSLGGVPGFAAPWTAACQAPLSSTIFQSLLKWVGDAIKPTYPLLPPSPLAFSISQHQGLFQWVGSSNQVAKILEFQHQSFQWILRVAFL